MMEPTLEQNNATLLEQKLPSLLAHPLASEQPSVKAYRDRNYRVVATARSVKPFRDDAERSVERLAFI